MDQVKTGTITNIIQLGTIQGKTQNWDKYQFIFDNGDMPFRYLVSGTPQPYKAGDTIKYKIVTTKSGELKMTPLTDNDNYNKGKSGGKDSYNSANPRQSALHAAVNLIGKVFERYGTLKDGKVDISKMGDHAVNLAKKFETFYNEDNATQPQAQTQQSVQQQAVPQQPQVQTQQVQQPATEQSIQNKIDDVPF